MKPNPNPFSCCCFGFMLLWVAGVISWAVMFWRQEDNYADRNASISAHLAIAHGTITTAWKTRKPNGRDLRYEFTDGAGRKITARQVLAESDLPKVGIDPYDTSIHLKNIPIDVEYDSTDSKNYRIKGIGYHNYSKSSKWVGMGAAAIMLAVFTGVFLAPMVKIMRNKPTWHDDR